MLAKQLNMKQKKKDRVFSMLLVTLATSLLGSTLAATGIIEADEGKNTAVQDFYLIL